MGLNSDENICLVSGGWRDVGPVDQSGADDGRNATGDLRAISCHAARTIERSSPLG